MFNSVFRDEIPSSAAEESTATSSVVSAMDTTHIPTRVGENSHPEFAWNTENRTLEDLRERTVQLFFQLVRYTGHPRSRIKYLKTLSEKYTSLIGDTMSFKDGVEKEHLLRVLRALPSQTRDCVKGKGERDLAYALLVSGYDAGYFTVDDFLTLMRRWTGVVSCGKDDVPPPGSWKDIVNLCGFIAEWFGGRSHPMIDRLIALVAVQIGEDEVSLRAGNTSLISLVAKWAPRESSKKNRWLFYRLVRAMNPDTDRLPTTPGFTGASRRVRKLLAELNRSIGTIEVKQCGGKWSEIDPSKVPSVTLQKQKTAFLNEIRRSSNLRTTADGTPLPRKDDDDRVACAKNFRELADAAEAGDPAAKVRAQRTSLYDLIRDALRSRLSESERKLLEAQWKDNGEQVRPGLPPMIPMVDTSGSMTVDKCTPLYYAIGLGLRASEKTHPAFRHRILTFSRDPSWVRLDEDSTFVERVKTISQASWGMNTDFYKALRLVLTQLVTHEVPPEDSKNLVLAVFSDMQIDAAHSSAETPQALHDHITEMYAEHGYEPPHILYWNLRITDGFPAVTTEKNVTMLSGFSPVLLNVLENKGIGALHEYTPFRTVAEQLDNPRFVI
jgi:hypothetical protein